MTISHAIAGFVICTLGIIYSGTKLSFYGDRIADLSGLSKGWIGLILLATVTSLPELFSGISSVAIVKSPDLAAGDVFGSCAFNLVILAVLDAQLKKPVISLLTHKHIISTASSIILISVAGIGTFMSKEIPEIGWISAMTPVIAVLYFFCLRLVFKYEENVISEEIKSIENQSEFRKSVAFYALNSGVVVFAALFLPYFGKIIAEESGLGATFFGTAFLASVTSLPELVVSFSAVRLGSFDLAVGNLLGSNMFNILILAIDDCFYAEGSVFNQFNREHILSVLTVIAMSSIVLIAFQANVKQKRWILGADTFAILVVYCVLLLGLYELRELKI